MKRFTNFILITLTSALTITGVLLYVHFKKNTKLPNVTTVTINEETTKNLKVDLDDIAPGSESTYTINIESKYFSDFIFSVTFYEKDDPGELSNYLSLTLNANEFTVTKSFKEVLENKETFSLGNNIKKISLTYTMDESVGNEAQDTYANFYIDVISKSRVNL